MKNFFNKHLKGRAGIIELLGIALPMVVSQACETVMMFTDRLFLSKLSSVHMAAAMSGGLTAFMMTTFFIGLTGYTTALVAQYYGSGKKNNCSKAVSQAVIISILSYPLILSMFPAAKLLFSAMGLSAKQQMLSVQYLRILMLGSVVGILRNSISAFFTGIGKTRIIMTASLVTMTINIAMNYVLIFGKFGFPKLGISGAAIGTVSAGTVGLAIIFMSYLFYNKNALEYAFKDSLKFDWKIMKRLLHFGYPGGLEFFLNLLAFNSLVLMLQSYSEPVAAAVTIAFNWDMVSFIPLIGVNISVTSLVGRYKGENDIKLASRSAYSGLKIAMIYGCIMVFLFTNFSEAFVSVFIENDAAAEQIRPIAEYMVGMVAFYILADSFNIVFSGALRGAGDTFWTMIISVLSHWLLVVEAILAVKVLKLSPEIAWTCFVFTIPVIAAAFFLRYFSGKWKEIKVVE